MRTPHYTLPVIVTVGILAGWPARGADPSDQTLVQARQAIERALTFLEKDAVKWRDERGCATCHHGTMTVWALSEAKAQGYVVGAEYLDGAIRWTKDRFVPRTSGPPGPGTASIPLIYLGMMSQNLPILSRDEMNRIALHLAGRQADDGAWESPPPKNGPPPTWESRESLALLALLAWEPCVPANALEAAAARARREKADAWLSKTESSDTTQALTLRLLLDARRGPPGNQLQLGIDRLFKRQNADGGWSQTKDLPSDAYATGQTLYALSFAGVKNDCPEIQRAVSFLASRQHEDGSWPMISRGHPGVQPFTNPVPITYFGTAWATLGLVRSVPTPPDSPAKHQHALDEIKKFHGKYDLDDKSPGKPVVRVDLRYYDVSDQEVENLASDLQAFPRLEALELKSAKITDAGLSHLRNLPQLRRLALEADITDAGLAHLKALPQLEVLSFKGTKVTDAGVQELLQALPRLKVDR